MSFLKENAAPNATTMAEKKSAHSQVVLDAMWEEASTYWLHPAGCDKQVSKEHAMKLWQGLVLESAETKDRMEIVIPEARPDLLSAQELKLSFSMPAQAEYMKHAEPKSYKWDVLWFDRKGCMRAMTGNLDCSPFVEDPPLNAMFHNLGFHYTNDEQEKVLDEYEDQTTIIRRTWNLSRNLECEETCLDWLRAAGLYYYDEDKDEEIQHMEWYNAARCVVAGVGVLARMHPLVQNNDYPEHSVFRRVMLRLERELLAWENPGAPDPRQEEVSESISRRGGILSHPKVMGAIRRENRWCKKTP